MRGLLVLLSTVAVASCSPTFGLLTGGGSHIPGAYGGGIGGAPGAAIGGGHGGIPGAGAVGGVIKSGLGLAAGIEAAKLNLAGKIIHGVTGGAAGFPGGVAVPLPGGVGGGVGGLRPGGRTDRGYQQTGAVYPVGGGGILQALGFLAQGLTDIVGNAASILDDVIHLRFPAGLDDGFNAIISLARGLGGIINAIFPGLGSLFGNVVIGVAKIFICVFGSPGISGSILGRAPGQDNPRDIPYICTPKFGRNWGASYDGPYDNANKIIAYYKISNAKQQVLQYIKKYTNGKGIDSLSGSRRIVLQRILIIAQLADKGPRNLSDDEIATLIINIIIINGATGDSYQPGLGRQIVNEWIITLRKNNKNKRFPDLNKYRAQIFAALKGANEDNWAGAFNQAKRSGWSKIRNANQDDSSSQNGDDSSGSNDSSSRNDNNSASNGDNSSSNDNESNNNNESSSSNDSSANSSNDSNSENNSASRSDNNSSRDSNLSSDRDNSSSRDSNSSSDRDNSSSRDSNSSSDRDNSSSRDSNSSSDRDNSSSRDSNSSSDRDNSSSRDSNSSSDRDNSSSRDSNSSSDRDNSSSRDSNSSSDRDNSSSRDSNSSSDRDNSSSRDSNSSSDRDNSSSRDNNSSSDRDNSSSRDSNSKSDRDSSNINDSSSSDNSNSSSAGDERRGSNSQSNSNNSDNSDDSDGSTYLHKRNASGISSKNSEENSASKSSSGSGKSQVNADGSRSSEYNFNNAENSSAKKSSETNDARSSELKYKHDDDC